MLPQQLTFSICWSPENCLGLLTFTYRDIRDIIWICILIWIACESTKLVIKIPYSKNKLLLLSVNNLFFSKTVCLSLVLYLYVQMSKMSNRERRLPGVLWRGSELLPLLLVEARLTELRQTMAAFVAESTSSTDICTGVPTRMILS